MQVMPKPRDGFDAHCNAAGQFHRANKLPSLIQGKMICQSTFSFNDHFNDHKKYGIIWESDQTNFIADLFYSERYFLVLNIGADVGKEGGCTF